MNKLCQLHLCCVCLFFALCRGWESDNITTPNLGNNEPSTSGVPSTPRPTVASEVGLEHKDSSRK
ncbi:hypothetical protein J6590_089370, partial [Homalodisca vitripennis]